MSDSTRPARRKAEVIGVNQGDGEWGVLTVRGGGKGYRTKPCEPGGKPTCPWLREAPTGFFPPEAFQHSANTAYDRSDHVFGCHTSSPDNPLTCAGFLLRGAAHNFAVRMHGPDPDTIHSDRPLYESYQEMAIANGVSPDDPALALCRSNGSDHDIDPRTQIRPYTHWVLFTSKPKAESCQAELADKGFTVTVEDVEDVIKQKLADTDDERWLLRATRPVTLNDLVDRHREVESVVRRHGGRYDGGEPDRFDWSTDAPLWREHDPADTDR